MHQKRKGKKGAKVLLYKLLQPNDHLVGILPFPSMISLLVFYVVPSYQQTMRLYSSNREWSSSFSPVEINVGGQVILQEKSSKLLGVTINDKENWSNQNNEKGGVISSLNQRLFLIKRLRNQVNQERLRKVAESLWTSRLRYGLQLYGKVRTSCESILTQDIDNLQLAQNNLLRTLQNVRIKDKVSIASMLERQKMMSVNQLHAQIKLTEMWKALNRPSYPLQIGKRNLGDETRTTRSVTMKNLNEPKSLTTFIGDATRLWNKAPPSIRNAKSIGNVKQEIKKFCHTLPI